MQHLGTQTLESDRLILRKFTLEDAKEMNNNWAGDPEVTKYLTFAPHKDIQETQRIIRSWMWMYAHKNFYQWCIVWKETGEGIGVISGMNPNDAIREIGIGYALSKKMWEKGIMTEALCRVIEFFFQDCEMNRIESRHSVRNPASGRVMQKSGMQKRRRSSTKR